MQSRSTSRSNSPGRSESYSDFRVRTVHADDYVHGFKVNIRPEKKSKLSSIVLKLRGIDEVYINAIYLFIYIAIGIKNLNFHR